MDLVLVVERFARRARCRMHERRRDGHHGGRRHGRRLDRGFHLQRQDRSNELVRPRRIRRRERQRWRHPVPAGMQEGHARGRAWVRGAPALRALRRVHERLLWRGQSALRARRDHERLVCERHRGHQAGVRSFWRLRELPGLRARRSVRREVDACKNEPACVAYADCAKACSE